MLTNISLVTLVALLFVLLLHFLSPQRADAADMPPLQTVERVDLSRYAGEWHEIARLEQSFQKGCVGSSATYTLRPDGEMDVLNSCTNESDGKLRQAKGRAWVVDPVSNARLKVSFFWPFRGDYWIIDLGEDYEYAVVGAPNRKYLWILARTPQLNQEVYQGIVERIALQGFAVEKLIRRPLLQ